MQHGDSSKPLSLREAANTFLRVLMGDQFMSASIEEKMNALPRATEALYAAAQQHSVHHVEAKDSLQLTPTPRRVLEMLHEGYSKEHICEELGISTSTRRDHEAVIRKVYGTRTTQEALDKARKAGKVTSS